MRVLGVIPARLGSTRLPNKPLQLLAGEPLITRVIQRVVEHGLVERAGGRHRLADDRPGGGAGRRARGADARRPPRRDRPGGRSRAAGRVRRASTSWPTSRATSRFSRGRRWRARSTGSAQGDDIGTAAAPLAPEHAADPARVKVVTDARGRALYFSRAAIPRRREPTDPADGLYWQHLGLYVYTRAALARWVARAAEPGRAGRAAGAAPRAALRSHDRRRPADRARAARRGYAGRSSTGGSPLARTTGVAI